MSTHELLQRIIKHRRRQQGFEQLSAQVCQPVGVRLQHHRVETQYCVHCRGLVLAVCMPARSSLIL
jgi:hypothetical protein